jgi:hypothetical protein
VVTVRAVRGLVRRTRTQALRDRKGFRFSWNFGS